MLGDRLEQGPPRLLMLWAVVMGLPVCGVAWLSWRVLEQDRLVERQRQQERCEAAADAAAAELGRRFRTLEQNLDEFEHGGVPDGAVFLLRRVQGLERVAGQRLAFYPEAPAAAPPQEGIFAEAERLEFAARQPAAAAEAYAKLASTGPASVRAPALMRMARALRRAGRPQEALAAYERLGREGASPIDGEPAEMLALFGSAETLEETGNSEAARGKVGQLLNALESRRWVLSQTSFVWLRTQCERWLGVRQSDDTAMAEAASAAWDRREPEREIAWSQDRPFLILRSRSGGLAVADARQFMPAPAQGPSLILEDIHGRTVAGSTLHGGIRAVRTAAASGLPWTVYAWTEQPPGGLSPQSKLVLAVLAIMGAFTLAGGYVAARLVAKELAVARLQSDFVSAVSHEFRSPVTALMQLSELLVRGRVSTDERRQRFYESMLAESKRLQRLVESLLNFGRFESGRYEYRLEPLELGAFGGALAEEFQAEAARHGHRVEYRWDGSAAVVDADREALGRVVWNLLDNAVKYSPGRETVWMEIERRNRDVILAVRDDGIGIAAGERDEIFRKFARGAEARHRSIRGTGIGLALSRMVMEAHGGRIEVESAPGAGSTFRMVLPGKGGRDGTHPRG